MFVGGRHYLPIFTHRWRERDVVASKEPLSARDTPGFAGPDAFQDDHGYWRMATRGANVKGKQQLHYIGLVPAWENSTESDGFVLF